MGGRLVQSLGGIALVVALFAFTHLNFSRSYAMTSLEAFIQPPQSRYHISNPTHRFGASAPVMCLQTIELLKAFLTNCTPFAPF